MNEFAYILLYLFTNIIHSLLSVVLFLMFARAILSWFPLPPDNQIENFLYKVTEPFILPARVLIDKIDALRNLPIDISFLISFIGLNILVEILSIFKA